ncbi:hypothetical protein SMC26_27535 [Actinomadura fulvescens]|uniref:Uncharacterized protein n=1 Tax=Actinomadura fulvescens TaxID=46160 RepID=A0ABP6C4Q3_9ACTN
MPGRGWLGKPWSAISNRSGRSDARSGSTSSIASTTPRSSILGLASAQQIGIPAEVQIRYSRHPQNQRE